MNGVVPLGVEAADGVLLRLLRHLYLEVTLRRVDRHIAVRAEYVVACRV
ncbi:hypothetical protein SDC9_175807 [bioreactor metagenome]|uniref:Uncharacterized protein n=1 Tax=bioreactor metagenome TaxID=1076179 RepID=A0A645GQA3_9ZZZZ